MEDYHSFSCTLPLPDAKRIRGFLSYIPLGGKVLDLGCGVGRWSAAMEKDRPDIIIDKLDARMPDVMNKMDSVGLHSFEAPYFSQITDKADLSKFLANDCRRGALLHRNILDFHLSHPTYDGIWARASLMYIPNKQIKRVLSALYDDLKPGGMLTLTHLHPSHAAHSMRLYTIRCTDMVSMLSEKGFEIYKVSANTSTINGKKLSSYTIFARKPGAFGQPYHYENA